MNNNIINNDDDDDDDDDDNSGVLEHNFSSEPQARNLIVKQKRATSKHNLFNQPESIFAE